MSSLRRRATLAMFAAILAGAGVPALAEYPEAPIKLVLPFAPGGETDPFARALGTGLTKNLGQPIVIENKPGAGGAIAFEAVARAPKDGYTLLMGFSNPLVVNPHLYKKLPYSVDNDFAPISLMAEGQFLLVVNADVPVKNVQEFIEYLKANPGKLNFASAGVGSPLHVAAELFMSRTGTKMVHVPYKSGGDAARGILTGEAQVVFGSPSAAAANIKTGKVRALAVTGPKRLPSMPELPTISESGLPGFEVTAWHSLMAPAGTPQPVLDKLHRELMKVLNSPELREQAERQGLIVLTSTPDGLRDRIRTESAMWGKVLKDAGINPE